jgi:ABC-type transport system involved in cytochrome c biogenesis permease subunit
MTIKFTLQGLLIYSAMLAYVLAFLAAIFRKQKFANFIYLTAFLLTITAFAYRWYHVRHVPFQNMFEVFLSMAMSLYPISLLCRRINLDTKSADILIAAILLFPAGFVFHAQPQKLPPALQSFLFIPHVAVYLLAYVIMAKAAVLAVSQIIHAKKSTSLDYEDKTYRTISLGFPLLTLGLLLGSIWGKLAWGDYWGWDPKELWSLASWLVYLGYFHFRFMFGRKRPRINSLLAVLGLTFILITLLWVNLSKIFPGLHNYAT